MRKHNLQTQMKLSLIDIFTLLGAYDIYTITTDKIIFIKMLEYIGSICIYNMIEYTAPILLDAIILIWLIFIFIIYAVAKRII